MFFDNLTFCTVFFFLINNACGSTYIELIISHLKIHISYNMLSSELKYSLFYFISDVTFKIR